MFIQCHLGRTGGEWVYTVGQKQWERLVQAYCHDDGEFSKKYTKRQQFNCI